MEYLKSLKIDKLHKFIGVLRNSMKPASTSHLMYVYGNGNNGKTTFFNLLEQLYKDKIMRINNPTEHLDSILESGKRIFVCEDLFHGEMKFDLDPLMKLLDDCEKNKHSICLVILSNIPLMNHQINHFNEMKFTYCQFQNRFDCPLYEIDEIDLLPFFARTDAFH